MIETVVKMELPVKEYLWIRKNRLVPSDCREEYQKTGEIPKEKLGKLPRISVVTGVHGDELEGQYVCYEIARRIKSNPEYLRGIVDLYPALNPLAIENAMRNDPVSARDMNRNFPGSSQGEPLDRITNGIVEDIMGSDFCVDVHASDTLVKEIPQVRVSEEFSEKMLPYARLMNVDMIWMNATTTVHESTLAHALNVLGIPTLVLEMGLGGRINRNYGDRVTDGIFNLMRKLGIWSGPVGNISEPVISSDGSVIFLRSSYCGIFLPTIKHNHHVEKGEILGEIVDSMEGKRKELITAPADGLLFTLREYPMVTEGSMIARILTQDRSVGRK